MGGYALRLVAALLVAFSTFGLLMSLGAVLDPVGAKHADDGDSFGVPPTTRESIAIAIGSAVLLVGGVRL